jgi:type IV secretion system protein TrbL
MNTGVIDNFTNVFTTYIDSGFGLLKGEVAYLASTLIVIDITLAGLFWAWAADEDVLAHLVKKTLYIGFFAFLIGNFNGLAQIIYNSFAGIGLKAAGSSLSAAQLAQPGRVAQVGLTASQPLLDAAGQLVGPVAFFSNFVVIVVLVLAWLIVIAAFFIMAVQLFVTLIEFKLTTLAGFILVPFGLFNQTAFLAEKVLGNVVASGVKVLVLAVVVGIGTTLFSQFNQGFGSNPPTFEGSLSLALAALSLLGLSIYAPGIATGLVSGAPQLGAGAAVGTLQAATGVVATTAGAMRPAAAAAERVTRLGGASMPSAGALSGPPAWARGLATMRRGVSSASHAVRSGDQRGGGYDVKLPEDDS